MTFGHGVVNRHAGAFVEDLDTEDLRRAHRAVLVGAGESDIEGQDLVGVERGGKHLVLADRFLGLVVELVDGRGDIGTEVCTIEEANTAVPLEVSVYWGFGP